jgi:Flp pilus assembly protein TadD
VREGALTAAEAIAPTERLPLVSPLLRDPVRTVRVDAARTLASVPKEQMNSSERAHFEAALAEYVQSQRVDADRAEAHLNLAGVYTEQGELDRVEGEYKTALALMPALGGTYVNFADLYRQKGRDDEGERILRLGLAQAPQDAGIHHALGLALVRQKRMAEALKELEKAATLPPDRPRYAYVYAVALDAAGQGGRALEVLARAHAAHPGNREILSALAAYSAKAGRGAAAVGYAKRLLELDPQDPEARQLYDQLTGKRAPGAPGPPPS